VITLLALALAAEPPAPPPRYAPGRELCKLASRDVPESSGVCASRTTKDVFWTHNDSGDTPRLFAFDRSAKDLGAWSVSASFRDWEDIASATVRGKPFLVVADVGDNELKRSQYVVHIIEEPVLGGAPARLKALSVPFTYPDGSHNCEALAIDATTGRIYVVTKVSGPKCALYELETPLSGAAGKGPVTAKRLAELTVPTVTAMDMDPTATRMVLLAGGAALEFTRPAGQDWAAACATTPRRIALPQAKQKEALCFAADGQTLILTSEVQKTLPADPTPVFEVPVL
jgi:hypothetical protein